MKLDESEEEIRLLWCVIKILITTSAFNGGPKKPTVDNFLNSVFDSPHIPFPQIKDRLSFNLFCQYQCPESTRAVQIVSIMHWSVKEFIGACFYKSFFFFTFTMTVTIPISFQFYKLIEMSFDWDPARKSKLNQLRFDWHVMSLRSKLEIVIDR
jgi:hypothetical protein